MNKHLAGCRNRRNGSILRIAWSEWLQLCRRGAGQRDNSTLMISFGQSFQQAPAYAAGAVQCGQVGQLLGK
jgi:hypothetical protein